jgi:hypothetical protein
MGDDAPHDAGDGAWLTYDQIAASRHITRRAAVRMTQRHHLRRQPGNDGLMRVWVPHDMAEPSPRVTLRDDVGDDAGDDARGSGAIVGEIAALRERAEGAERRAEKAEQRADQADADRRAAEGRADQADADRRAAIALADQTVALLTDTVARADQAEQGREAARERAHELANRMLVVHGAADRAEAEAGELRRQMQAAQIAQAEAEADAEELRQADAVRRGRGRLARLRAAWRGE